MCGPWFGHHADLCPRSLTMQSSVSIPPAKIRFIRLLATRLHEYGTAAHRLEGAVGMAAERLGLVCEIFSTPTSIFLTFRDPAQPEDDLEGNPTQLVRLRPGTIDTDKLCEVDAVAEEVASGAISVAEGTQRLKDVEQRPPVAPLYVNLLCWSVVGTTVAILLRSAWVDIGIAAILAMVTGLFTMRLGKRWQEAGSFEAIIAFIVTGLAYLSATWLGTANVPNIVIAAMIILMPGLDLTIAITELSTGHLASGTSRFAGAVVVLLKLAMGVVLATQIAKLIHPLGEFVVDPSTLPPSWTLWAALAASGLAFGVLFNANRRDWLAILIFCMLSYSTNYLVSQWLGSEAGVFIAALTISASSNVYARWMNRPATVVRLPGIILLVPGSLGYRALTFLFSRNLDDGLDAAVSVGIVLAALVGGLLLGNTLIQPRRNL